MNTVQVVVKVVKVGYNVILAKVRSLRRHHIVLVVVPNTPVDVVVKVQSLSLTRSRSSSRSVKWVSSTTLLSSPVVGTDTEDVIVIGDTTF